LEAEDVEVAFFETAALSLDLAEAEGLPLADLAAALVLEAWADNSDLALRDIELTLGEEIGIFAAVLETFEGEAVGDTDGLPLGAAFDETADAIELDDGLGFLPLDMLDVDVLLFAAADDTLEPYMIRMISRVSDLGAHLTRLTLSLSTFRAGNTYGDIEELPILDLPSGWLERSVYVQWAYMTGRLTLALAVDTSAANRHVVDKLKRILYYTVLCWY
jgi:hypothetical protein